MVLSLYIFTFGYIYFVTIIPAPPKKKSSKITKPHRKNKDRLFLTTTGANLHYTQIHVN